MKYASFPAVTRVTVVGKNGLAFEDYTLMKEGAELHIQDQGHTLKVFPWSGDLLDADEGSIDVETAEKIADQIMREENIDNLTGFGEITMGRIRKMLIRAARGGQTT